MIFSLPISAEGRILQMLKKLWVLPVDIRLSAHSNKLRFRPRSYSYLGNVPVLDVFDRPIADWDVVMKWLFDKIVGSLALIAAAPLMALVALAIKLDSRGPVLFKQKRYGFNNELIEVYKFRSMYTRHDRCHRVRSSSPRTIRASPASAASSARPASTSCRSSSTWCSRATSRWSARGRTRSTPRPRTAVTTRRSTAISRAIASSRASPAGRRSTAGAARPTRQEKIQQRVEHDLYYIENWSVLFDLYILAQDAVRAAQDRERLLMIARSAALPYAPPAMADPALPQASPGLRISTERLRCLLLWLTGASGAIVFIEPSPYEIVVVPGAGDLRDRRAHAVGRCCCRWRCCWCSSTSATASRPGRCSASKASCPGCSPPGISRLTALFFAAMLGANTQARLNALMRGCVIGGVIASLAAIIGYFRIFPGLNELLLLYDRARGTFKDPNVLGAFLILPGAAGAAASDLRQLRAGRQGTMLLGLSWCRRSCCHSRAPPGARWSSPRCVVLALTFITTRSPSQRLRIVLLSVTGVVVLALFIAALLSIDVVADLFKQRASLEPELRRRRAGPLRAGISLGAVLALDEPFGIGPLQFAKFFPEDPHNSYLNAFMAGGWLAGACYPTLVALTLAFGLRAVLVAHAVAADHHRGLSPPISASRPKASSSTPTTGGTRSCCSA